MSNVHLKKLCVGCYSRSELARWQQARAQWAQKNAMGNNKVWHDTRSMPKRADTLKISGSLYWIIRGAFSVRQKIINLTGVKNEEGTNFCRIWLAPSLVSVVPRLHRPFQGWRYLEEEDTPSDVYGEHATSELDEDRRLNEMLVEIGLV